MNLDSVSTPNVSVVTRSLYSPLNIFVNLGILYLRLICVLLREVCIHH